ncbi:hypothetical protein KRE40_00390 [Elizabethkingia meningoseptica]|uniref:MORN repeat variant n=2 Tax=Weeksellaceae TaxID=2762318 RepID=A0A1V3TZJ7_ELIME|nr:hypothetical protein BBD33_10750 [Elizabethkingia meningoseptica]EOR30635.1 hypothetical protein L100_04926 [Elizabethkingia meningoseptica ATCC 13253 = NBRC 12535]AQX13244.1 hypothetical protein BBD35_13070 [Elizabethkingia meningoseptica]AQX47739.1 hypothetical protein B5G46_10740 [Elizabethkingia meningoseptica]EJK5328966.1 hypothetical protein [Elizabethkingia meningoseptica]
MNMKKYQTIFTVALLLFFVSCSTKYNQRDAQKQRHGKWKETLYTGDGEMLATGRYKHGEKRGLWKYSYGDRLVETEKYRKNTAVVKSYHPNGRMSSKGQTRTDVTDTYRHWYAYGIWKYYDENGKLTEKPKDFSELAKEKTQDIEVMSNKELQENKKRIYQQMNGKTN